MKLEIFVSKYKKEPRLNSNLSPEHIDESMKPFLQPNIPEIVSATALDSPLPTYELLHEIDLQDTLPYCNSILIYRILKKMYSKPDIVGAFIQRKATKKSINNITEDEEDEIVGYQASDWSYSLRINNSLIAEIRSMFNNTRLKLRFWSCYTPEDKKAKKGYGRLMANFLEDLHKVIEHKQDLFQEKELISNAHCTIPENIHIGKYKAAEMLLNLADTFDARHPKHQLKFEEKPEVVTTGSIYLSSAILFIISLESLINLLYLLLHKKEFDPDLKDYERITIKSDIDLRLLCMHVYCDGFKSKIISPNTEIWKKFLKLRDFRNTVIHGNIKDDHKVYALLEDNIEFFYGPTTDYRGKSAAEKAKNRFPVTMPQMTKETVLSIKEIVDEIVESMVIAMDDKTKIWVKGWMKELVIPPLQ